MWETGFKTHQNEHASVWGPVWCRRHTDFFAPTYPAVNFKHKITTSSNYTGGIGTGYTSHDQKNLFSLRSVSLHRV